MLLPMTELEAVNILLGTIGESPVNSLDAGSAVADSVIARATLAEISRTVQSDGWHFNTDEGILLYPDLNGFINLPANCVKVDTTGEDELTDVVARGVRLYNKTAGTYVFTQQLRVDMVTLLDWDELPQPARYYITIRAARVFQNRAVGSELLMKYTANDELQARAAFLNYDAANADYSILNDNWGVVRVLSR